MADKLSHSVVQYGPANDSGDRCDKCEYYIKPKNGDSPGCKLVVKPIHPSGWCNKFEPK